MSLIFTESFDSSDDDGGDAYFGKWNLSAGLFTVSTLYGRNGNGITSSSGVRGMYVNFDSTEEDDLMIVGFAYRNSSMTTLRDLVILYENGGGTEHLRLQVNTLGQLIVVFAGFLNLATSIENAIQEGVYHYIEFKALIANAGGYFHVQVDGVPLTWSAANTGLDTRNGGADGKIDRVQWQSSTTADSYDDIYILNGVDSGIVGRPNNDFLGDVIIECLDPSANGNSSQFLGSDGNSTDNYQHVDENSPDGDTTYVGSGTDNQKDTYVHEEAGSTGSIAGVAVYQRARKTDAGARSLAAVSRYSGSEEDSADLTLATTYGWHKSIFEADPSGAAWTTAKLRGASRAEFGPKSRP